MLSTKPTPQEYPSFYKTYIDLCPEDLVPFLKQQIREYIELLNTIDESQLRYSYAPGKWDIGTVIQHVIDTEVVFSYRALAISRGEKQNLPGFDQDDYVTNSKVRKLSRNEYSSYLETVRSNSTHLIASLDPESWGTTGSASGNPVALRAIPYMIGGHAQHHLNILKEKYLI